VELSNWSKSVERFFDGYAPRLVLDANVRSGSDTVVALYFETHQGAPFVVENTKGNYPEFVVPWREGTGKRAARRDDLLRILVPIRRFSALIDELAFNQAIVRAAKMITDMGSAFRQDEFHRVIADGALSSLPIDLRDSVIGAYLAISRANQLMAGALTSSLSYGPRQDELSAAWKAVRACQSSIDCALVALSAFKK